MFIDEVINSYKSSGQITVSSDYSVERVKDMVYTGFVNINRFNGITTVPYNLLKHSMFVSSYARDLYLIYQKSGIDNDYWRVGLCGLFHDIGEVVVGDTVYPMKKTFARDDENGLEFAFVNWFVAYCYGIELNYDKSFYDSHIKIADRDLGVIELIGLSKEYEFSSRSYFEQVFDHALGLEEFFEELELNLSGYRNG